MKSLIIENLYKKSKDRVLLNNINLIIRTGEIIGLLGPNGAGKTTCFNAIIGLIIPDNGNIFLDNQDITHYPIHLRARLGLGYLPQEASVFRELSVYENIMAILEHQKLNNKQRKQQCDDLLINFQLHHQHKQKAKFLSGGQRRRLEVARALAASPRFILLDEPFANIDPISIKDLQKMIIHLSQENIGILITDHNVRETLEIAHRNYVLNQGEIIAEGNREIILANEQVQRIYLGREFKG